MKESLNQQLSKMTLEEKASLCSGLDFWHLKGIERLGIASIMVTDGPHGLRKAQPGTVFENTPATCFPTASATACSWDRGLLEEMGRALGEECQQEDVAVILGPGTNIKRSPLCGRNFEYFSEDPFLAGEMAASLIKGVQGQGVGTSLKHFAANNQEYRRMTINAVVDERALREIYLPAFERAVKQAQPWTIMNAYNRLNGTFCSENDWLLNKVLRDEWGFEGLVMTDWGANNERVAGLKAGQDLEMPGSSGVNDAKIAAAVRAGELDEGVLDKAVLRILDLVDKASLNRKPGYRYDKTAHHALARRVAANCMVLLKNEDSLLPLDKNKKIAVSGVFARQPRYQGAGSSSMNPSFLDNAAAELEKAGVKFSYSPGYETKGETPNPALIRAACEAARAADVAVVFAGLPDVFETEGADREHMRMPESHNQLIQQVAAANPNTVVVLSNGAPVEMPWAGEVKAILEGYLGGQAGAGAVVDILLGAVNPSGKLAETFPMRLEDVLSSRHFPSGPKTVEYRESLYVGYRYFDSAKKEVLFPFGYGLSYTSFEYTSLKMSAKYLTDRDVLTLRVKVRNSGKTAGAEVVQVYVRDNEATVFRPEKELMGFEKVMLNPGEEKEVQIQLYWRAFAFYNTEIGDWTVENGDFEILVGASSQDIRLKESLRVESKRTISSKLDLRKTAAIYYDIANAGQGIDHISFQTLYGEHLPSNVRAAGEMFDLNTPLGEMKSTFIGGRLRAMILSSMNRMFAPTGNDALKLMALKMVDDLPLRNMVMMSNGQFSLKMVNALLRMMNGAFFPGLFALVKALVSK